jgi:hypothetical protein
MMFGWSGSSCRGVVAMAHISAHPVADVSVKLELTELYCTRTPFQNLDRLSSSDGPNLAVLLSCQRTVSSFTSSDEALCRRAYTYHGLLLGSRVAPFKRRDGPQSGLARRGPNSSRRHLYTRALRKPQCSHVEFRLVWIWPIWQRIQRRQEASS